MIRTREAGSLRPADAGTGVVLAGWVARRRDHGGVIFLDLRDASGVVQVVLRDGPALAAAHAVRAEWCLRIDGVVEVRPEGNANPDLASGAIEVSASVLDVLSEAATLPFPLEDSGSETVGEETRLRYRYLDLRRPAAAQALRVRGHAVRVIRSVMDAAGFLDVETPTLTRSTPEGARDFLVPVRLQPGSWYALPQSPQLFKQLLMVAGIERYYQIARCWRDEDLRADRQPEFTQLDVELSFLDEEDVYALVEQMITRVWAEVIEVEVHTPFPRLTWAEAMSRYGSDKPDTRFGLELTDLTGLFADTGFRVFQAEHVGAVVMPGGASQTRKELDGWQDWVRGRGGKGLAYVLVEADGSLRGPVAKNLSAAEAAALPGAVAAAAGDCIFFAAGARGGSQELLGAVRLEIARRLGLVPAGAWDFLWVTDWPMFEPTEAGGWTAVHHPFTAPATADEADFDQRPGDVLARAYDLAVNGVELGGGSIRIHRAEVQQRVFDVLGLSPAEAQAQFGFLLEAFAYGPPPHGGIAFGIDRLAALLAGADTIRDVIAFPKVNSGGDPLTGAPTPITAAQRAEAGVDAKPRPAAAPAPPTDLVVPPS